MRVTALWMPLVVADAAGFEASARFYRDLLGLAEVDGWDRDGEHGAVYAVGASGRIEIVRPAPAPTPPTAPASDEPAARPAVPPIALELPDRAAVDRLYHRLRTSRPATTRPAPPTTFPRGHYGFTATDPAGYPVLLWTEATR